MDKVIAQLEFNYNIDHTRARRAGNNWILNVSVCNGSGKYLLTLGACAVGLQ